MMIDMNGAERHKMVCYQLNAMYEQKNKAYGDSFHKTFQKWGLPTALIRLGDKMSRLENIALQKEAFDLGGESFKDTLLDLANYAIMTVMELDADEQPVPWEKEN